MTAEGSTVSDARLLDVTSLRGRWRLGIAETARRLAFASFAVAVVLSPFRAAILLAGQPRPPLYGGYTDFSVSWAEVAGLVAVLCWVATLLARPHAIAIGPRTIWAPALVLLCLAWASTSWSIDPVISGESAALLTLLIVLGVYAINEVPLGRVPILVAGMVGVQAVVAIGQSVVQGSLGLGWLGELSLAPAVNGVSVVATSATDRFLRAYGLADHPNILGGILAVSLPLVALGLARGRRATIAAAVVFVLGAAALFVTFSRGAWLAAATAIVIELVWLARARAGALARRVALVSVVAGVVVLGLAVPAARYVLVRADLTAPQVATEAMSTGERLILMDAAASVTMARPLLGSGLATAPEAIHAAYPNLGFDAQPPAVAILDVAIELGLLGALSYLALLVAPWLALARRSVTWTPELIATSAALAGWTVVGLFDYYPWTFSAGRIWSVLLIALWAAALRAARQQSTAAMSASLADG